MNKSRPKFTHHERETTPEDHSVRRKGYALKGRIWLEGRKGTFIGYGRVVLLERIREYGSISEAAKSMGMSYKRAWELVDSMNRQSRTPLVEKTTGGKGGGGARLTQAGEKAIGTFWKLHKEFGKFLKKEVRKLGI